MNAASADEVAALYADSRPGLRLSGLVEVAAPVYRMVFVCLFRERSQLAEIEGHFLRAISLGMNSLGDISGFLGLDEGFIRRGPLDRLLRSEDVDHAGIVSLTDKGKKTLEADSTSRQVEVSIPVFFDPFLRRLVPLGTRPSLLREKEASAQGLKVLSNPKCMPPRNGEVRREDVRDVLREAEKSGRPSGRAKFRELIDVVGIETRRTLRYRPGVVLVFERPGSVERQLGVVFDGELSPAHDQPLVAAGILEWSEENCGREESAGAEVVSGVPSVSMSEVEPVLAGIAQTERSITKAEQALANAEEERALDAARTEIERLRAEQDVLRRRLDGMAVRPVPVYEHRQLLEKALKGARERVIIISPFVGRAAVNREFIDWLEDCLRREVKVTIGYGMGEGPRESQETFVEAVEKLKALERQSNGRLRCVYLPARGRKSHAKALICDDSFVVTTSFNWLSFRGDPGKEFRNERGIYISDPAYVRQEIDYWLGEVGKTGASPV